MYKEIVAEYLSSLKRKTGLTYEAIAEKSERSLSTVKNLCLGKSDDPRIDTIAPIVYALGGSIDEMMNPDKNKDELKETSVIALKDSYEYQAHLLKEANEIHIGNIRAHYEQHHEDLKENFERRLADKRELIETKDAHIKTLEKDCRSHKIAFWICASILVVLLIIEVSNPSLGWIQF
jgi:transcriptional regulator with XRE-family HTH domain